jgi:uncharacterized protein (TIGR02271 family)
MAYEKIVAVYDNLGKARDAQRALEASGFPNRDISALDANSAKETELHDAGWWGRIFGREVTSQESGIYGRAIANGGSVLTLRTSDTQLPQAMRILDGYRPLNVNERSSGEMSVALSTNPTFVPASVSTKVAAQEEVLRLTEEQIDIGKREVETGKARIRRFVTEKPVESQITLHEEHADIERRAVTDPTLAKEVDWADKTIEVTETGEEVVVTKSSRVVEEVIIHKKGSDSVQFIRDRVRRQEVEFERLPNARKTA